MRIAILDDYQDAVRGLDCMQALRSDGGESVHQVVSFRDTEKDPLRLAARLADFDCVVLTQQRSRFPRAVVERLPALRLVCQTGRSTAHIDVAACSERGVVVCAAGQGTPHAPAELTWALILGSLRQLPLAVESLKQGRWQPALGRGVFGRTLGIYGLGRIGACVAAVGRAFGMRVVCFGREGSAARARAAGYEVASSREAFFAEADVLSLHLPLLPRLDAQQPGTQGIVTARDLARMKPEALLVNTSRAALIEDGALVAALAAGRPGQAAVDVFEDEPVLSGEHPLLRMPSALCTPHIGYVERETYERYFTPVVELILAYAEGRPLHVVNPEALGRRPA